MSETNPPRRFPGPLSLAALVFAWLAGTAWARWLMAPDEGRYVGVAWEMLRSGDWLNPTLNGLPYFHKPPLFYWINAASMSVFGVNEWAGRMASMLGGTLGVLALYVFVRRWGSERAARYTLLALLAQPLWLVGSQFANLDTLVAGCISATILLLAHAVLSFESKLPHRRALAGAYATAALGVLAKGLIGFVIPALVIVVWLALRRRWRSLWSLVWWPGILLFLAVAAPWFIAMERRFPGFLDYFFVYQHFTRFTVGGFNNRNPAWFYPAVLAIFCFPWLPWLAQGWRRERTESERSLRWLMVVWALAVPLFFSLPKSKLLGYVLPAIPPLAYLAADGFMAVRAVSSRRRKLFLASALVSVSAVFGTVGWIATHPQHSSGPFGHRLAELRQADEPVFMLDYYRFDLAFYAGLKEPVRVVDNWADPEIPKRDNRRKELLDAGNFAPEKAASILISAQDMSRQLCANPSAWILAPFDADQNRYPFLQQAALVLRDKEVGLWHVVPGNAAVLKALGCG